MSLVSSAVVMAASVAISAQMTDTVGPAKASAMATALAEWFVNPENAIVSPLAPAATWAGSGGVVTEGTYGRVLILGEPADLGLALANAVMTPSVPDAPTIAKWTVIATALCSQLSTYARVTAGANWVYNSVGGGPITGTDGGTISFTSYVATPLVSAGLGVVDAKNLEIWDLPVTGIFYTILKHIEDNASVPPLGLAAPAAGPLTGVAMIT